MKKRKGSLLQRMMAALLSAALVTGMVSNAAPVTVLAQEPEGQQESVSGNPAGTVEGGTEMEEETEKEPAGEHKHNDVTFIAWTKTDSLPTAAGNYYLTENVTLDDQWYVPSGETSLCLNGKNIRFAEAKQRIAVINIQENAALKLLNCDQSGIGGKISGGFLFGVLVDGSFYMYGGTITENGTPTAITSAGVINQGTFYMYGGGIEDNRLPIKGIQSAGLVNNGTFYMYGGKIVRNITDSWGAGVCNQPGKTMVIGGSAMIADNEDSDGCKNNLFLHSNDVITVNSQNPLSGSEKIGVLTDDLPGEGKPVNITGTNSQDYHRYFFSDDPNYIVTDGEDHTVQLIVAPHDQKMTLVPEKPATCTEDGKEAYYHCEGCDKYYEDEAGTTLIADISAWGNSGGTSGGAKEGEPKTGDSTPIELSATLAMIAGFAYLLLYFANRGKGMTEETRRKLVSRLIGWAKQGGRIRRCLALAAIFILLVYYHSIGKKAQTEWKAIYGE